VFMGTPHRGAQLAELEVFLRKLLGSVVSDQKFLRQLKPGSETIMEITHKFKDRADSFHLLSYYEQAGVRGVGVSLPYHDYSNIR